MSLIFKYKEVKIEFKEHSSFNIIKVGELME